MYIYKAVGATSSEGFPVRRMIGAGAVSHRRGAVIESTGERGATAASSTSRGRGASDADERW